MKVEINVINVEDGDAIILMLKDNDRKSLILIDGGYKKYYPKLKRRIEEVLPLFDNKIDLLICTHYDNDHIGGVEKILDDYHTKIEQIWIHKIDSSIDSTINLMEEKIQNLESHLILESNKYIKSIEAFTNNLVIEGYKDLLRVIQKIKNYGLDTKIIEAKQGDYFEKFPEFSVISPSSAFYNKNLPELKEESILEDLKNNIRMKSTSFPKLLELLYESFDESGAPQDYCEQLEKSSLENGVTATNMVSIVTLLEFDNKRFLFTGDSGIESYEPNSPNWKEKLKNLLFLIIPHHGSKNNSSYEMLSVFNPIHAFVSGKSSENRPSVFIEKCLKGKERLKTFEVTNKESNTWYLSMDENGNFKRILE
jgi:metal-dependent hydrolase (beta-lactamase superfamily II)